MKSSGVMYLKFKDQFQQSAVATAWVFSLYTTFLLMLGIVFMHQSFETPIPKRPGNSGPINFSVCKALIYAMHCRDIFVKKKTLPPSG